jgi:hypothetical protein
MSDIWETVTVEPCVTRPGEEPGWVYFIACAETRRCKIGYTRGPVEKRMKSLQTGAAGKLRLIAKHPGTPETERKVHARFSDQRLHGEWFEMSEELFAYICLTIWHMATMASHGTIPIEDWMVPGLRMIRDTVGAPLPDELEKMIGPEDDA